MVYLHTHTVPALRGKDYGKTKMKYSDYTETESGLQYKVTHYEVIIKYYIFVFMLSQVLFVLTLLDKAAGSKEG